jgi:mannobiose 2-epimerase
MDPLVLRDYAQRIETELKQNILPFWIKQVVDHERGGFYGELTNGLEIHRNVERGALLSTRILWTYSAAYRQYKDPVHLEMARRAYDDLEKNFRDRQYGGYYWSITAEGKPFRTRKQVYGQAFAIYALSEYHRASGLREPLDQAIAIYHLLEKHGREPKFDGYLEAFSREWGHIDDMRLGADDMNEPKSQNTHLHVMEAYTNLMRVWPDARLKRSQTELLDVMLNRILDTNSHHLGLFFAEDWTPRSTAVSYGHDIEACWLLMEAASVLGDADLKARIKSEVLKTADASLAQGVDTDGAIYNEGNERGVTNTNKEWWPQAEAVVGFIDAYEHSKDERFLKAALRCWDFIEARLLDRVHGEWFRGVTRDGDVLQNEHKVSFWKCPYHNGRACMEAPGRLRAIAEADARK